MTRQLSNIIAAFSFVVVTGLASQASADTYSHIDGIAKRIENRAKQIVRETRHYIHTPEYHHLRDDALEMARLADHIHEVAHHHGDIHHLESDLAQLDAQFHHLESLFDRIEHNAAYGYGHVHGHTAHVKRLLDRIEDDIHHLQDDVRELRTSYCPSRVIRSRPVYVPDTHHGHGHSGIGFSIGGGSSRITFRF